MLPLRREGANLEEGDGFSKDSALWEWRKAKATQMLKFMAPALILPLADPLMSIIDTICIGKFTGTLELASLGPTSVVFSFFSYVFNALGIATTTCVANSLMADKVDEASRTASSALSIAIVCSLVCLASMQAFGPQMIAATGAAMELRELSEVYLRVRSFAQPALLTCIVTQSVLMAERDSVSPSLAVLAQVMGNTALDLVLIVGCGLGVVGAAWGTVVAQYLGAALLLTRMFTKGRVRYRKSLPSLADVHLLWTTLAPLAVVYLARNLSYMQIQVSAAALIPIQLAAHQAVWSMYTICSFANTTLEQAGLAFIPTAKDRSQVREFLKLIVAMGAFNGLLLGLGCYLIATFLPTIFTSDAAVWPFMAQVAPFCAATLVLVGLDVAAAASLIAMNSSTFLARAFVISLVLVVGYMQAAQSQAWGLAGVWSGLLFFFACRFMQSVFGFLHLDIWKAKPHGGSGSTSVLTKARV